MCNFDDFDTEQQIDEFEDDYGDSDDEPLGMSDVEADADTLAAAGLGTDEDYGYFGDPDDF